VTTTPDEQAGPHPVLVGRKVTLRPGRPGDAPKLRAILAEPSVSRWWAEPDPVEVIEEELRGDDSSVLLVVEIDGKVAGGIQYHEENDPMYRQAGIDIYLSGRFQGRGAGTEAVRLLARFLFEQRGHHRITIDPAAANEPAIRCYAKVGFRPVGVMRRYERGPDGTFHDGLLMDLLRDELTRARLRAGGRFRGNAREAPHPGVNRVSCIPSGARTRAFRSPHGVVTGGATRAAPAATSRSAISPLSSTCSANRTVPDTRRPASIASTDSAWALSNSSSVARPASRTTTRPVDELQSAICSSPSASR
jgi:aminoglycoside 6'-N-acetyltransferase